MGPGNLCPCSKRLGFQCLLFSIFQQEPLHVISPHPWKGQCCHTLAPTPVGAGSVEMPISAPRVLPLRSPTPMKHPCPCSHLRGGLLYTERDSAPPFPFLSWPLCLFEVCIYLCLMRERWCVCRAEWRDIVHLPSISCSSQGWAKLELESWMEVNQGHPCWRVGPGLVMSFTS